MFEPNQDKAIRDIQDSMTYKGNMRLQANHGMLTGALAGIVGGVAHGAKTKTGILAQMIMGAALGAGAGYGTGFVGGGAERFLKNRMNASDGDRAGLREQQEKFERYQDAVATGALMG